MGLDPVRPGGWVPKFVILFLVSLGFYLGLGRSVDLFNLATGGISAIIVSLIFARITFDTPPRLTRILPQLTRTLLFIPYLIWEIVKANVAIAYLVLHPALPIDPQIQQFEAGVSESISIMALAVSITLTPGTVVIDVRGSEFHVHALTRQSWMGLLEGGLERAVRFVFYGRSRMQRTIPPEHGRESSREGDTL